MPENMPSFLSLAPRTPRPRTTGLGHVLDKGCGLDRTRSILSTAGAHIDIWKFGWGTAYLDPNLEAKLEELDRAGVRACTGGTLLEVAWAQDRVDGFFDHFGSRFRSIEVSNGAIGMSRADKSGLITRARDLGLEVFAEVGLKDSEARPSVDAWIEEALADLDAGAAYVVAEGRESGTVGLYEPDGEVRDDMVTALVDACGPERIVFETPRTAQQVWFLRRLGPEVNLGNIALDDALGVEALRLGLRADTIGIGVVGTDREAAGV